MTTPEGRVEAYLIARVRESGGYVRKLKWISRNGAPDRMVWWRHSGGAVYFVEVKRRGEKPTPQQHEEHVKMKDSGLNVVVVDTNEKIDIFIANAK